MKKIFLLLSVCAFVLANTELYAQRIAVSGTNFKAHATGGTPASSWYTSNAGSSAAASSSAANPDASEVSVIPPAMMAVGSGSAIGAGDFIWSTNPRINSTTTSGYQLTTAFLKTHFNVPKGDCRRYFVTFTADDNTVLKINGVTFGNYPYIAWNSVPANKIYDIEITDALSCGNNVLVFEVTDVAEVKKFFIAEVYADGTSSGITENIQISSNANQLETCVNHDLQFTLTGASSNYCYEWTGPNGFTSTEMNPLIPNSTKKHTGTYTVKIYGKPACEKTLTIEVETPEDCCDGELKVTKCSTGCFRFNFEVETEFTQIKCDVWQLNGVTIEDVSCLQLNPGVNEVCVYWLGVNQFNQDHVCACEERCTTITIPSPDPVDYDFHFCSLTSDGYTFDVCDLIQDQYTRDNFTSWFIFQDDGNQVTQVASGTNCSSVTLGPGTYGYMFFDENCMLQSGTITVTDDLVETECEVVTTPVPCMYNTTDLDTVSNCCSTGGFTPGPWKLLLQDGTLVPIGSSIVTNLVKSQIYKREWIDATNCLKCVQKVTIPVIKIIYNHAEEVDEGCCKDFTEAEILAIFSSSQCPGITGPFTVIDQQTMQEILPVMDLNGNTVWSMCQGFFRITSPNVPCCELLLEVLCHGEQMKDIKRVDFVDHISDVELLQHLRNRTYGERKNRMILEIMSKGSMKPLNLAGVPNPTSGQFKLQNMDPENEINVLDQVSIYTEGGRHLQKFERVDLGHVYNLQEYGAGKYYVVAQVNGVQQAITLIVK